MNFFSFIFSKRFLLLVGIILSGATAVSGQTRLAVANETAVETASVSCYNAFLPLIVQGDGATFSTIQGDVIQPPAPPPEPPSDPCANPDSGQDIDVFPDFNGDGYGDLLMGIPNESVMQGLNYPQAGAAHALYGTANGFVALAANAAVDDQLWSRATAGLGDTAVDSFDYFGSAIGLGDFNNDGYDDAAIGVPGSYVNGEKGAGVVQVLYGSANGLTAVGTQTWSQGHVSILGAPEADDGFGEALAVGDFNNDGHDDLAVGVPRESVDDVVQAGAVNIIYGSANGLTGAGDEILTQDVEGYDASSAEEDDLFGHTLEAGDFNGDGIDDLVVSSPYEDTSPETGGAGSVQIFYGNSGTGLYHATTGVNAQNIQADSPGIDNAMELGDRFGFTLAVGDFNGDGKDDLAIGTPYETHGAGASSIQDAGAVNIVFGSDAGLDTTTSPPILSQATDGAAGIPYDYELFGFSLTAADFNNDGFDDLAAGIPFEDVSEVVQIGAVQIFYSDENGPSTVGDDLIYDAIYPDDLDRFGRAVTAVDSNGDGYPELIASATGDDPQELEIDDVGSIFVFFSDSDGVSQTDFQNWYQSKDGMSGTPENGDQIGKVLP